MYLILHIVFVISSRSNAALYTHYLVLPPTLLRHFGVDNDTGGDAQGPAQGAACQRQARKDGSRMEKPGEQSAPTAPGLPAPAAAQPISFLQCSALTEQLVRVEQT